jgi:hypothetical protein
VNDLRSKLLKICNSIHTYLLVLLCIDRQDQQARLNQHFRFNFTKLQTGNCSDIAVLNALASAMRQSGDNMTTTCTLTNQNDRITGTLSIDPNSIVNSGNQVCTHEKLSVTLTEGSLVHMQ